jgi:DNA polymerase-3 subunit delta
MAEKKAGEVEAFLSRPDTSFPTVLLYGPDAGLVSERAARIATLSGVDLKDPFAAISLAADELEKDIGRLHDEARTISMFGGRRLIRVRGAGTGSGKALAEAVAVFGKEPPVDVTIVVEAGDMKKNAPLRIAAEKGRASMALPCYQDEGQALDRMIDEEMKLAGLTISRDAKDALRSRLGANRLASRGEVQKLCLYCLGKTAVEEADIEAIVGDVSVDTVEETIDAAASGEVRKLPELIARLTSAGTAPFLLHQGLLRYFQALQLMRQSVERGGQTVSRVVESRRPHFRRKVAMETAVGLWNLDAVAPILAGIEADILASRKESALAGTIVRQTLLTVAVEAARLRSRGRR